MTFAAWYSFRKMLPGVRVSLGLRLDRPLFRWSSIFSCPISAPSENDIVFPPTVIAVREFMGSWEVSSSKSEVQTCFVNYSEGCGNFVADKWINTNRVPFHRALKRFGTGLMTVNEAAVFRVWEACDNLFRATGV
jgi:hypothetical protein